MDETDKERLVERFRDYLESMVLEAGDTFSGIAGIKVHQALQADGFTEVLDPELLLLQVTSEEIILTEDPAGFKPLASQLGEPLLVECDVECGAILFGL